MLRPVDPRTYKAIVDAVPEHPEKVRTHKKIGTLYYEQEEVYDQQGNMVAIHVKGGGQYADLSLLDTPKETE